MNNFKFYILLFFSLLCANSLFSQSKTNSPEQVKYSNPQEMLTMYEDSIQYWAEKMLRDELEMDRYKANKELQRVVEKCLEVKEVLTHPFEKVKAIAILSPDDKSFRIFNWHLRKDNETYTFFAYLVKETKRGIEFFTLNDKGMNEPNIEFKTNSYQDWPGAHYYQIIQPEKKNNDYYLLLGWNGNNKISTKKVVEVLHFQNNQPKFGFPVFKTEKRNQTRIVFEYSKEASMSLRYDEKKKWIVFDNLSPREPQLEGMYSYYGPDFSINALNYVKGKWLLEKGVDVTNEKSKKIKYNQPE